MQDVRPQFTGGDYELVVGKVRGLRRWMVNYDGTGVLVGATGTFWNPSTNLADCSVAAFDWHRKTHEIFIKDFEQWLKLGSSVTDQLTRMRAHDMRECTCGFYAYHSTKATFGAHMLPVLGVIEGWGRVTYGDKGFRSEYAKIVAIVDPTENSASARRWYLFAMWFFAAVFGSGVYMLIDPLFTTDQWSAWPLLSMATNGGWMWWTVHNERRRQRKLRERDVRGKVQAQYPNVKIYPNKRQMLKDFPIEKVA